MEITAFSLKHLTDAVLVSRVHDLVREERKSTATLIAHLAELDERRLYLAEGCSSVFTYCVEVLHLSEHAAYRRIKAARAVQRFPIVLEKLAEGSIHPSALILLLPHLTPENHLELLEAAKHQRKRSVEKLIAALRPQPPVASVVRKLPAPQVHSCPEPGPAEFFGGTGENAATENVSGFGQRSASDPGKGASEEAPPEPPRIPRPRPAVIAPLAPERYKFQFTGTEEDHEMLQQLQELLRHRIPDGDPAVIFHEALLALREKLMKQKVTATDRPRRARPAVDAVRASRHIPADVRREVWARDQGRCAFIGRSGRRCTERGWLEFHHVKPFGWGGLSTVENIELRCRPHNAYEGERVYGAHKMKRVPKLPTSSGTSW